MEQGVCGQVIRSKGRKESNCMCREGTLSERGGKTHHMYARLQTRSKREPVWICKASPCSNQRFAVRAYTSLRRIQTGPSANCLTVGVGVTHGAVWERYWGWEEYYGVYLLRHYSQSLEWSMNGDKSTNTWKQSHYIKGENCTFKKEMNEMIIKLHWNAF